MDTAGIHVSKYSHSQQEGAITSGPDVHKLPLKAICQAHYKFAAKNPEALQLLLFFPIERVCISEPK